MALISLVSRMSLGFPRHQTRMFVARDHHSHTCGQAKIRPLLSVLVCQQSSSESLGNAGSYGIRIVAAAVGERIERYNRKRQPVSNTALPYCRRSESLTACSAISVFRYKTGLSTTGLNTQTTMNRRWNVILGSFCNLVRDIDWNQFFLIWLPGYLQGTTGTAAFGGLDCILAWARACSKNNIPLLLRCLSELACVPCCLRFPTVCRTQIPVQAPYSFRSSSAQSG